MKLTRPLASIDIESTGVDPVKDRIIELGVEVCHPDGGRMNWAQRFNPGMPIPAEATAVHGITNEEVADCLPFSARAPNIHAALRGKDIAGYNLRRLDLPLLDEEFRRCGLKLDLTGVQIIDAFGIFQKKEPRKLEDAVKRYCKRDHAGAHGAAADAEATLDVILAQVVEYEDLGAMDLEALAEYSRHSEQKYADIAGKLYYDAQGDVCYAFGKHKDSRVIDQPGYAEWMISKDFPGSTKDALMAVLRTIPGPMGAYWRRAAIDENSRR